MGIAPALPILQNDDTTQRLESCQPLFREAPCRARLTRPIGIARISRSGGILVQFRSAVGKLKAINPGVSPFR